MGIEYRGRDAILRFACQRDECTGDVEVHVPREPGDYSRLRSDCVVCGAEHELDVAMHDDGEYTDPSNSGLRSGKGTGLLRQLFFGDGED